MALTKIVKNGIGADAIDATKLADDAISEEHLDVTSITGHSELSATAASDDVLLVFDTSASALKKIQASNINSAPTITSISPTNATSGDGTGNHTFTITGTNFNASATAFFINNGGTEVAFDTVTRNSATQITGVIAKSSLLNTGEPFDIVVENPNGQTAKLRNQVNVDASPVFATSAGSLGTFNGGSAITTINIVAQDPDSAGAVSFEFQSGSLPAGLSSATVTEDGVSKFRITGTPTNPTSNTTSNFTLRAVDAASNTSSRAFSITVNRVFSQTSFTSSGTFAVPSGTSALDAVLVVAGGGSGAGVFGSAGHGGGGAGGLIFQPCVPVTPGGTITVTVGCGGAGGPAPTENNGQDSVFGASPSPGISAALTAKGGGSGGGYKGKEGGSGGGGAGSTDGCAPAIRGGGTGNQPTQPGNSGAYGFGNNGGAGGAGPQYYQGGGGGGAGAAGQNGSPQGPAAGGIGKAYTIADGTTSVYYAGGGGGGQGQCSAGGGAGGQGGGGAGSASGAGTAGSANTGGGAGGSSRGPSPVAAGGKGIVIVRF